MLVWGLLVAFGGLLFWTGWTSVRFSSVLAPSRTGQITRIEPGTTYSRLGCASETLFLSGGGPALRVSTCGHDNRRMQRFAHDLREAGNRVRLRANQRGDVVVLVGDGSALNIRPGYDRRERAWGWVSLIVGGLLVGAFAVVLTLGTLERLGWITRPRSKAEPRPGRARGTRR